MYKNKFVLFMAIMSLTLLFGCGQSKTSVKSTNDAKMLNTEVEAERAQMIKRNEAIANDIVKINGVKSSYVMISDQNAYVAVSLDMNEQATRDTNISKMDNSNNYKKNDVNMTTPGAVGNKVTNDVNMTTPGAVGNKVTNDVKMTTPGAVGNKVKNDMKNMTENATGAEFMSTKMRSEIEAIVKKKEPTIKNVHISASPDFVIHMNGYMSDLNSGKAMKEVMNDFNQLVRSMFP